jgi:putative ABC transport system permease protein
MTYQKFVLRNIGRKKTRMLLTMGSFAVALFLFGVLVTINNGFYAGVNVADAKRLMVKNKASIGMLLPFGYRERIAKIPGVKNLSGWFWFTGIYKDSKNFFVKFAVDDNILDIFPEFIVPRDQWDAYLKDRQGCIVGRKLADRFGFKIGDRIPLKSTFPGSWEFNVRAIYENSWHREDTGAMFFHHKLFAENLPLLNRTLSYIVQVDDPARAQEVISSIDAEFANSADETFTETEQVAQSRTMAMFGNIKVILSCVGAVVFVTLMLVTGSTMAMAIRERADEIGVMKTLGFTDQLILLLVLSESVAYGLIGGGTGLLLAKLYTLGGDPSGGMLRTFHLSAPTIIAGLMIAASVGLLSGIMPALGAMRLRIVDALRRV